MAKSYRVGIIGFAHMHINNVAQLFAEHPQVQFVACADTELAQPEQRVAAHTREWSKERLTRALGIPKVYEDYRQMLAEQELDIAIVTSENARHAEVVEACATAGVHACVEKPMAGSLSDGLRMVRACGAAGTTLLVNWPNTWSPAAREAKAVIDRGAIGRVLEVKYRSGHRGPLGVGVTHPGVTDRAVPMTGPERAATWWHQAAQAGGAMLDYCGYGAMISRWYIGEPAVAAFGLRANLDSQWGDADDNGVIAVRFPRAMALIEGSWTTLDHGVPTGPIVYGTEGTLVVQSSGADQVVVVKRGPGDSTEHIPEPLPAGRQNVAQELIYHLETGEALHLTVEMMMNLEYMAILDAGIRSAASGQLELVDSAAWCIG